MVDERTLQHWRDYRQRSLLAIPITLVSIVVVAVAGYLLRRWLNPPGQYIWIPMTILAFTLVMEVFNVVYLGWRIRREGQDP